MLPAGKPMKSKSFEMSAEVTRKASSGAGAARKRAEQGPVVKAYLVAYNVASMLGWAYVIAQIVQYFVRRSSDIVGAVFNQTADDNLFNDIQGSLKLVQTAAFLEVLHSLFGLVRSPVATTAIQGAFVSDRQPPMPKLLS